MELRINMATPTFSVIIPTYQEESSIPRTLESLRNACNGHGIETIIVDGGSTDRTAEIARQFTDSIHILEKRGIGLARNYGASLAGGDVLVFIDSDTMVPENFFDELMTVFSNPAVSGANCNVMPATEARPTKRERGFYSLWGRIRKVVYRLRPCGTGENGIIVRRDVFRSAGGFDESMSTMEDLDFVFRAAKHGKFVFLNQVVLRESIRRARNVGLFRFSRVYIYNFLYYLVKRKPRITSWEAIR